LQYSPFSHDPAVVAAAVLKAKAGKVGKGASPGKEARVKEVVIAAEAIANPERVRRRAVATVVTEERVKKVKKVKDLPKRTV
jgi:hypothetical protein